MILQQESEQAVLKKRFICFDRTPYYVMKNILTLLTSECDNIFKIKVTLYFTRLQRYFLKTYMTILG